MKILLLSIFTFTMQTIFTINFENKSDNSWTVVNDSVMGGLSNSSFEISKNNTGTFSGTVSLENNGGFASIRKGVSINALKKNSTVTLHLKGDGKDYQFRLKNKETDYHSYIKSFKTSGDWETISFNLSEMYPAFRGRSLNLPNFNHSEAREVAFLIGNKKNESFRLEIKQIVFE